MVACLEEGIWGKPRRLQGVLWKLPGESRKSLARLGWDHFLREVFMGLGSRSSRDRDVGDPAWKVYTVTPQPRNHTASELAGP